MGGQANKVTIRWNNHSQILANGLLRYYQNGYLVDTDVLPGDNLKAHRIILALFLPAFKNSMDNMHGQMIDGLNLEYVTDDCEDVRALIEFIYTGAVTVSKDRLVYLGRLAECLQFEGLAKVIAQLIANDRPLTKKASSVKNYHMVDCKSLTAATATAATVAANQMAINYDQLEAGLPVETILEEDDDQANDDDDDVDDEVRETNDEDDKHSSDADNAVNTCSEHSNDVEREPESTKPLNEPASSESKAERDQKDVDQAMDNDDDDDDDDDDLVDADQTETMDTVAETPPSKPTMTLKISHIEGGHVDLAHFASDNNNDDDDDDDEKIKTESDRQSPSASSQHEDSDRTEDVTQTKISKSAVESTDANIVNKIPSADSTAPPPMTLKIAEVRGRYDTTFLETITQYNTRSRSNAAKSGKADEEQQQQQPPPPSQRRRLSCMDKTARKRTRTALSQKLMKELLFNDDNDDDDEDKGNSEQKGEEDEINDEKSPGTSSQEIRRLALEKTRRRREQRAKEAKEKCQSRRSETSAFDLAATENLSDRGKRVRYINRRRRARRVKTVGAANADDRRDGETPTKHRKRIVEEVRKNRVRRAIETEESRDRRRQRVSSWLRNKRKERKSSKPVLQQCENRRSKLHMVLRTIAPQKTPPLKTYEVKRPTTVIDSSAVATCTSTSPITKCQSESVAAIAADTGKAGQIKRIMLVSILAPKIT